MVFSQPLFLVFLAALLLLYAGANSYRQRAAIVLVGSLIFYASWKPAYLILLVASVTINYWIYHGLTQTRSRNLLIFGLVLNLTLLGVLKYLVMAIETLLGVSTWLGAPLTGLDSGWAAWALPLGISFYTFHMLSVMIDVYRGEWTHPISFRAWSLYVTFFPHMIAGPILRASELVEQLENLAPLKAEDMKLGGLIFLAGLIKKVLFADNLAPLADDLFAQPDRLDFYTAWLASTAFALQIYFDFSGYSEMAIGLARMFGVTLPRNFRNPYLSRSPREFWQRWHITLSRWLRDYLYISLGGNRHGLARNLANLMITMILGGLWHGAAWTFAVWGALHGSYLVAHRLLLDLYRRLGIQAGTHTSQVLSWLGWPTTLVAMWFTWVFFRSPGFAEAWSITSAMLGLAPATTPAPSLRLYVHVLVWASLLFTFVEARLERSLAARLDAWGTTHFSLRGLTYAGLLLAVILFGGSSQKFIYFDF